PPGFADGIPSDPLGDLSQHIRDEDTRAPKGQLAVTDLRIRNDVAAQDYLFVGFHGLPILHEWILLPSASFQWIPGTYCNGRLPIKQEFQGRKLDSPVANCIIALIQSGELGVPFRGRRSPCTSIFPPMMASRSTCRSSTR